MTKFIKQALFTAPVLFTPLFFSCERAQDEIFLTDDDFIAYQWENHPGSKVFDEPSDYSINFSDIVEFTLSSTDPSSNNEVNIHAAFIGNLSTITNDTVILFCHGGKFHMDYYYPQIKTLYQTGSKGKYNLLIFDYQGLGLSEGTPSIDGLIQDGTAAKKWLSDKGVQNSQIICYGKGLGAIPACHLTQSNNNDTATLPHLILENPVAHSDFLLSNATQLNLPTSYVSNDSFDNVALIKKHRQKLLILLSEEDEKYPAAMNGELLYQNHSGSGKHKVLVKKAMHESLVPTLGFNTYLETISDFLLTP